MQSLRYGTRGSVPLALVFLFLLAWAVSGQERFAAEITGQAAAAELRRLQDRLDDTSAEISRLRELEPERARRLQPRLDDLRDECVYLRVKLGKEGLSREEVDAVRARVDSLHAEAREETRQPPAPAARGEELQPGLEFDVRLDERLSSKSARVEDRLTATTVAQVYRGDRVVIPAGATVRGVVLSVNKAGRVDRTGKLSLAFDRVTVDGRGYPMHATVVQALEGGGYGQDARKIGTGAGLGAVLGGLLGGVRGALAGIVIGGGGVVAATEGQDVTLAAGAILRLRLESPLSLR
mgnify:CR=1 FL=1